MTTTRHAKGYGDYARATGHPRHRADHFWTDSRGRRFCSCGYPLAEPATSTR